MTSKCESEIFNSVEYFYSEEKIQEATENGVSNTCSQIKTNYLLFQRDWMSQFPLTWVRFRVKQNPQKIFGFGQVGQNNSDQVQFWVGIC